MRRLSASLVVLVLIGSTASQADFITLTPSSVADANLRRLDTKQEIEELALAVDVFRQRDYEQCFTLLKTSAEKHPDLPPARFMLARLYLSSDQVPQGRAVLEYAAAEHPEQPEGYLLWGDLALAEGRWTDALVQFERAAALAAAVRWSDERRQAFDVQVHQGLAAVAERRSDWATARTHLAAWLERDPKDGEARQRLALCLFTLDKPMEAYTQLQQAVKDDSTQEPAALVMAWLYTKKDLAKADEWMEYAVKLAPNDPRIRLEVAEWLLQRDRADQAKSHVEAAAKLEPDSRRVQFLHGLIARHLKDYARAECDFDALHRASPRDLQASNQLALALVEQPDQAKRDRAMQLAEVTARLHPNSFEALATLGWVYYRHGKRDEAERALQAAVSGGEINSETAYYLAHVVLDRGRQDDAKQLLQKAIDAPGRFVFRKEARDWLNRLSR